MVSAKELADFKSQYGEDKTLRDLLNADKGLRRRDESSAKKAEPEVKKSGTPDLPVTKAEASEKTSPPEKKTGIGPYNAFSGVGDYLNKTFTMEGREQAKKEAKERFGMKKGGTVRSSASSRADGIAQRGKTKGRIV